jgi:flagellar motor protein MotB
MADALTLVLASFVLLTIVGAVAQRSLVGRLRERERELERVQEDKARVERRLNALGASGRLEVEEGKVILQGEVLFDSGSDELRPAGRAALEAMVAPLGNLLALEPDQMVLIGGHTDDRPLRNDQARAVRFPSNLELSTARAVAVARVLVAAGLPARRVVPAGFAEHHPRAANENDANRRRNRRIEVQLVPVHSVSSR